MVRSILMLVLLTPLLLLGAPSTQPTESFTVGSVWMGTEMGDPRRPHTAQARSRPAKFSVVERKETLFSADYSAGANAVHLEGKVDAHGQLMAHATRVIKGSDWGPRVLDLVWTGNISGDELNLSYTQSNNLVQTVQLVLDSSADSSGKHRKKQ